MMPSLPKPSARFSARRRHRRGSVIVYSMIAFVVLLAFVSFAVDLGRAHLARTELQRAADATARGALALYLKSGSRSSAATQINAQVAQMESRNPVATGNGENLSYTVTWGRWDNSTRTFSVSSTSKPTAVRVVGRKTITMPFAGVIGHGTSDIEVQAIAALLGGDSYDDYEVDASLDPWLAGMPNGSKASYNDRAPYDRPPYINVTPGTYMSFEDISGWVHHVPASSGYGPEGKTDQLWTHGADSPGGPTPAAENGIQDVVMPITAFMGVFLTDDRPDSTPAPTPRRDYSTESSRSKELYDDIKNKQPFFIGDGKTPGGTIQRFKVPDGATRLYLSIMDGYEWNNNSGGFEVDIKSEPMIVLVK